MLAAPCDLADEHSDETWQPEPDHLLGCSMVAAEPEAQSLTFSPYDGAGRDDSQSSEGGDSSHHNDNSFGFGTNVSFNIISYCNH